MSEFSDLEMAQYRLEQAREELNSLRPRMSIARTWRALHKGLPWGPDGSLANSEDWDLLQALEMEADCALGLRDWGDGQTLLFVCWECGRSVAPGSGAYFDRAYRGHEEFKREPKHKGSFLCQECLCRLRSEAKTAECLKRKKTR